MQDVMSIDTDGKPSHYAWPGGYEVAYYHADGERCCYQCLTVHEAERIADAEEWETEWLVAYQDVYWEGAPESCAHCGAECASEYGDPEAGNE